MIIELNDDEAKCLVAAGLVGLKGTKQIQSDEAVKKSLTDKLLGIAKELIEAGE